ncbi:hypothetical protein DFJ43DRAFT_1037293 [Lentinula guzmanii]|uniref:DUF6533 domain-containing protein n=1 Tax=Lentinula guzmanii TaxID=2804957 RepID=A0AA38JQZ9_9AGAR|nr:hypothetical protein DFJ43DRAFT_1037293 [Lentinula guzmanii]
MDNPIAEDGNWMVANYVVVAASTLWIAEFIESLPTEINTVWLRKITGTSILFLLNRYMLLLGLISQALMILPGSGSNEECQAINTFYSSMVIITSAITSFLFALRAYAIYNKSKIILGISSVMISSIFILEILITALEPGISTAGSLFQTFSRCKIRPKGELPLKEPWLRPLDLVQTVVPIAVFGYDLFIFIITVKKTAHQAINMRRLCPGQSSVTQVIIRDGCPVNFDLGFLTP